MLTDELNEETVKANRWSNRFDVSADNPDAAASLVNGGSIELVRASRVEAIATI